MEKITKDQALSAAAVIILLFSAMISWNIYSWLTMAAIELIVMAWYFKK